MKPTVGRIVHYTNLGDKDGKYPPEQQSAIITGIYPNEGTEEFAPPLAFVDLQIFYRTGQFHLLKVPFSKEYQRGHWSWPVIV